MSRGIDLRVSHSLELLSRLKETIAQFSKREELLQRELNSRRGAMDRRFREAMEQTDTSLAAQISGSEASLHHEQERLQTFYQQRRTRIQRAYQSGLKNLQAGARQAKERWLGDLQVRHLRAERSLPLDLRAADDAFAQFSATLAEQHTRLENLVRLARRSFAGHGKFVRMFQRYSAAQPEEPDTNGDRDEKFAHLQELLDITERQLDTFRRVRVVHLFSVVPPFALAAFLAIAAFVLAFALGFNAAAFEVAGAFLAVAFGAGLVLHRAGISQASPAAEALVATLVEAERVYATCVALATVTHERDLERIQTEYERTYSEIDQKWNRADEIESRHSRVGREKLEKQMLRVLARHEQNFAPKLRRGDNGLAGQKQSLEVAAATHKQELTDALEAERSTLQSDQSTRWTQLESDWQREVLPVLDELAAMNETAAASAPAWDAETVAHWVPPAAFAQTTKFGSLVLDFSKQGLPRDSRLALPTGPEISAPLALQFPEQGSILFESADSGDPAVTSALNNVILRLLSTTPPGKVTFTIIDPVGLGQNFAGLMHLADYEEGLINRRIWTQREQIEERLEELNAHIEKVIQMYLRNEFATISEYNAQAGSVAEKYHFLVVADFPANFSETAAKRLQSIAVSGPRCGVFTLMHRDLRQPVPDGFVSADLSKASVCIRKEKGEFTLGEEQARSGAKLSFDAPPDPALAAELTHKIGKTSIDSNRVEVPFSHVAPASGELWKGDTTNELRVAIGRTGATKLQYLAIGKGTKQHALFAGKTGSGKSTLFHVIITNLALSCSPDQVEFYLIDFKKGVEFKCYATQRLPHARVVAIESDREFGLSVLQRVDEELKRRGDLFRKLGVQDIPGYKKAGGTEPMPRTLLIIDEFQEFFVDDDAVAQSASLLFDRIVRQGRAFGIHVLLGSQTLGGAYTLARATLGQMAIRVALQCNEADAYLIMDDNNSAPRLLSRPGEGIYNDAAGAMEGNSPFQVVWLGDDERDACLEKVHELALEHHDRHPSPVVFEGNAPADIRENDLLQAALEKVPVLPPPAARCWFGAPNSIKGPTQATFHRQSGNNLLIVGQREEAQLTMLGLALVALGAQYPVGRAKFVVLHSLAPGSAEADFLERIAAAIPHGVTLARSHEAAEVISELASDLKSRNSGGGDSAPATFLLIHGLQRFKKLRQEDDFSFSSSSDEGANTGAQLTELITEGSGNGIHLVAAVDTYNNVNRFLNRKALSEFEMRIVFQMSANDSASLIDSPLASNLGLHRAFFYNEQEGQLETFRPYAPPDAAWIDEAAAKLAQTHSTSPELTL